MIDIEKSALKFYLAFTVTLAFSFILGSMVASASSAVALTKSQTASGQYVERVDVSDYGLSPVQIKITGGTFKNVRGILDDGSIGASFGELVTPNSYEPSLHSGSHHYEFDIESDTGDYSIVVNDSLSEKSAIDYTDTNIRKGNYVSGTYRVVEDSETYMKVRLEAGREYMAVLKSDSALEISGPGGLLKSYPARWDPRTNQDIIASIKPDVSGIYTIHRDDSADDIIFSAAVFEVIDDIANIPEVFFDKISPGSYLGGRKYIVKVNPDKPYAVRPIVDDHVTLEINAMISGSGGDTIDPLISKSIKYERLNDYDESSITVYNDAYASAYANMISWTASSAYDASKVEVNGIHFTPKSGDPAYARVLQLKSTSRDKSMVADPVDSFAGNFVDSRTLLDYSGYNPLSFKMDYDSIAGNSINLESGFSHNFESRIVSTDEGADVYITPSQMVRFKSSGDSYTPIDPQMLGTTLELDGDNWVFTDEDFTTYVFNNDGLIIKTTDKMGLSAAYQYTDSLLTRVQNDKGQYFDFTYTANDKLKTVTDIADRVVTFNYSWSDQLSEVVMPSGELYEYYYSDTGKVRTIYYADKQLVNNTYDDIGRVSEQTDGRSVRTTFKYDEFTDPNSITTTINTAGRIETYTHNETGDLLSRTDGAGYVESYRYDDERNMVSFTNGNGDTTSYKYDDLNRLLVQTDPDETSMQYHYDDIGNMNLFRDKDGATVSRDFDGHRMVSQINKMGGTDTYTYDSYGDPLEVKRVGLTINYAYDAAGYLASISQGDMVTSFENDSLGRAVKTTLGDGSEIHSTYDTLHNVTSSTDASGNESLFEYNVFGDLIAKVNALGVETIYEYDNNGNLISETTADRVLNYTYNDYNELTLRGTGSSWRQYNTTEYAYNSRGDLVSEFDQDDVGYKLTYDGAGNVLTRTEGDAVETYAYDTLGNMTAATDAEGHRTDFHYDDMGNHISTISPSGAKHKYRYDELGRMTAYEDGLGNITIFSYDSRGNLIQKIEPNGAVTSYEYNALNLLTETVNPLIETTSRQYNSVGQLESVINELGDELFSYEYNALGEISKMTDANGGAYSFTYDASGQLLTVTDSYGEITESLAYNVHGDVLDVTDALGHSESYAYDEYAAMIEYIDPMGRSTEYAYTDANRLDYTSDANGTDTYQTYDDFGNINSVGAYRDPMVRYTYDSRYNVSSEQFGDSELIYSYDSDNRLNTATNGRGDDIEYEYDANGDVVKETTPEGAATFKYDAVGNLISSSAGDNSIIREYDLNGNVLSKTQDGSTIEYTYDAANQLVELTYPSGDSVTYTYDALGNILTVTDWNDNVTRYEYNKNNQHVKTINANGIIETRSYDAAGQLLSLEYNKDSETLFSYTFEYDAAGNIVAENDKTFVYDSLNRLVQSADSEYNYSSYGNIASFSDSRFEQVMRYNTANGLTQIDGVNTTLDADGNLIEHSVDGSKHNAAYDSKNRLISYDDTEYSYDIEDNRIGVNGVTYVVDNDSSRYSRVLVTSDDGVVKQYVYGNGLIGDGSSVHLYDYRGSTVGVADSSGAITGRATYDDFGGVVSSSGLSNNPFLYNGKFGVQTDANGLSYMRARYYNPEIKRFMNRDVVVGSAADPQTLNRYAFVNGDPISYNDPFGLAREASGGGFMDFLHVGLDAAGFIPGFGAVADFINAGLYISEGNWTEAFWSGIGAIPGAGDSVSAIRIADRGVGIVGDGRRKSDNMVDGNFLILNKRHKESLPQPKGLGPNNGRLQSHHVIQQQWAKVNLPGYDGGLAPTITLETYNNLPHSRISILQNARRDNRVKLGSGKWSSSVNDELGYAVNDLMDVGFSRGTVKNIMAEQYLMLDKLKVPYERVRF